MADNVALKDANSTAFSSRSRDLGSGVQLPMSHLADASGASLVGQKTKAASLPVALASDDDLLGRVSRGRTFTGRSVGATVANASTQLMAANAARQAMKIQAPQAADLWINELGGTAAIGGADCFCIPAGSLYEPATASVAAVTYLCATASLVIAASEA